MMHRVFLIAAIALTGLAAGVVFTNQAKTTNEPVETSETDTSELTRSAPTAGQYLDYKENIIAETTGTKLLFFHAGWCSQCRQIEESIVQQGVPKGVSIIKVDYDSATELRQKYKVTLQTTFVKIDDQGNELKKYTAYNEPNISAVRRELL